MLKRYKIYLIGGQTIEVIADAVVYNPKTGAPMEFTRKGESVLQVRETGLAALEHCGHINQEYEDLRAMRQLLQDGHADPNPISISQEMAASMCQSLQGLFNPE